MNVRARSCAALSFLLVLTSVLVWATPAAAAVDAVTGDLSDPELVSFEVFPTSVDVTDGPQTVKVTARWVDEGTGVEWVSLSSQSPNIPDTSFGASIELVSGDRFDGVYEGSVVIPKGGAPGSWRLFIGARDRVNNDRTYEAEALVAAGWPGHVDVTSRNPDLAAPSVVDFQVLQPEVDVRAGPGTSTVRVRLTDDGAGTRSAAVIPTGPHSRTGVGGIGSAGLRLVSGTPTDGWWEGVLQVKQYAHAGAWQLAVSAMDELWNGGGTTTQELQDRGLPASITVLSEQDVTPPVYEQARLSSLAVDVSQSDQEVSLDLTISDDLSGVQATGWGDSQVVFSMQHLGNGQYAGSPTTPRLSGDARHGTYRPSLTIPRSSATGAWLVRAGTLDEVGNEAPLSAQRMVELGLPASVLVYNTPLPPLDLRVEPLDGAAVVEWTAPADDRGAEVTEYIVTESPQGEVVRTTGDQLSAVIPNLTNDVQHSFVVQAVNRAGPSDASTSATTVPTSAAEPAPTATASPGEPAVMPPPPRHDGVTRLAGSDRYTTAVAVSQASFPSTANDVFVVTGTNWPDALAAGPAAASVSAPVLPVQAGSVPTPVLNELTRLQPRRIWVVGGSGVISERVLQVLRERGATVTRISGGDRYATAAAVAARFLPDATGAYYASGDTYADALGGGAAAARRGWPLLLTKATAVPAATPLVGADRIVLGGTSAITEAVRAQLGARRVAGSDRFGTAAAVARDAWGAAEVAYLATGLNFPDALAGAAAAARDDAPLLLARGDCITARTREAFTALQPRSRVVLGGLGVVGARAADLAVC